MIKHIDVEIEPSEIANFICQYISEDDFRTLIECFGITDNYNNFFNELWEWTEWKALYPSGVKFLKRLKEELNKMDLE